MRTPGKNFDEFYRRAVEDYGVNYIKGQVGKVIPQPNGKLLVQGADLIDNKQILKEADMVVLAAAIERTRMFGDRDHAHREHRHKQLPYRGARKAASVESPTAGIFLSARMPGTERYPETVSQQELPL